jgi:predicted dehydrogenase
VVWVCTPPFVRREPIEAACQAGKPIFCEKPLALNEDEMAWVRATVKQAGVPFFMGQSNRFLDFFRKMKELVEEGAIGEPTMIWSTRIGYLDPAVAPPWRMNDNLGGGTVIELGVHEIDFIRWVGGEWQSVYARGSSKSLVPGEFQDTVAAVGTLANDVIARLDIGWANPRYLWQRGVEGTKGSLFFDDQKPYVYLNRPNKEPEVFKFRNPMIRKTGENLSLTNEDESILEALATNGAPTVTLQDGAAAVRVALAMRESSHSGRIVKISQK